MGCVPPAGRPTPSSREHEKHSAHVTGALPGGGSSELDSVAWSISATRHASTTRTNVTCRGGLSKHVEVLAEIFEDVPDGQKVRVEVACRVAEVRIPGQYIHSAPLLHTMPRVVDEDRVWRRLLQFLQKDANAPLDSFAIMQIPRSFALQRGRALTLSHSACASREKESSEAWQNASPALSTLRTLS